MKKILVLLWLPVFLSGCVNVRDTFVSTSSLSTNPVSNGIAVADKDSREYKYLTLENRLKVLLISDAEADKAAAALSVSVGSAQDPVEREGLAHFLEHMLFLGTDKFPEPDEYQAYISAHGGSHNAYTAFEETNYFFDIDPSQFSGGLERFSRFFVAPLFNETYVEREKHAVHSEYMTRIKNDYRRQQDAYRQVANPKHPSATFSVGNLDTLADKEKSSVRDDLLVFYRQHYSANRMTLAVTAPLQLEELEQLVRDLFADVPDFNTQLPVVTEPFLQAEQLPLQLSIRPQQELRQLQVLFELPSMRAFYRQKPLSYLGHLLGHEGSGSLLSQLKRRGWGESLSAGASLDDRTHTLFQVSMALTEVGMQHQTEILALLFAEIELIKSRGVSEWRHSEVSALAAMQFRYQEKTSPSNYVRSLATNMHYYPKEDVLRGPYRMDVYDGEKIAELLGLMTPDKALIVRVGPDVAVDQTTELYHVPYGVSDQVDMAREWKTITEDKGVSYGDLALPEKNPYVPTDFSLLDGAITSEESGKPGLTKRPILLKPHKGVRLWHYQTGTNSQYPVPKAQIYVAIKNSAVIGPKGAALTDLYLRLVQEKLNETSYEAALAGLSYSVNRRPDGFGLLVSGFDDKLPVLVSAVVEAVAAENWNEEDFERVRLELIRHWRNSKKDAPYRQVWRQASQQLALYVSSPDELVAVLEQTDAESLKQFVPLLVKGAALDILVSGNLSSEHSKNLAAQLSHYFLDDDSGIDSTDSSDTQASLSRPVVALTEKSSVERMIDIDHPDAALIRYYQGRNDSLEEMARFMLLRQIVKAPFYNSLRTEQQLGYVVAAVDMSLERVPGLGLLVQSPVVKEEQITAAIDQFIETFNGQLASLTAEKFEQYRAGLMANLRERPKSLAEQSSRFWGSIDLRYLSFDSRQQLMRLVENLTVEDIRELYRQVILAGSYSMEVSTGDADSATKWPESIGVYKLH